MTRPTSTRQQRQESPVQKKKNESDATGTEDPRAAGRTPGRQAEGPLPIIQPVADWWRPGRPAKGFRRAARRHTARRPGANPARYQLEPLEPRFLLNGELSSLAGAGAFGDMAFDAADGFLAFGSKLEEIITTLDDDFAGLPGMLTQRFEVDGDGNITGEETRPPKIADVLSQSVERDPNSTGDLGALYSHGQDFSGNDYQALAKRADYLYGQANTNPFTPLWEGPAESTVLATLDLDGDGQASWREAFDVLFVGTMLSVLDDFAGEVGGGLSEPDMASATADTASALDERTGAIAAESKLYDLFGDVEFFGSATFNDLLSLGSGGFTFAANDNAAPDFYTLGFSGRLDFGFDHTFDLDFGIIADQLGIQALSERFLGGSSLQPSSTGVLQPEIDLAASLDIPLEFSFALPEVGDEIGSELTQEGYDAYVGGFGLRAGTFVGDGSESIQMTLSSNQDLEGLFVNAGFLGLQAINGSTFTLDIIQQIELTPASLPSTLGFDATLPLESSDGVLTADSPLPVDLDHAVEFELAFQLDAWQMANDDPTTPVTVVVEPPEGGDTLQDAVEAALADSGLDDLLAVTVVDIGGEDHLRLALNESSNIAQLALTPTSTNVIEMTLTESWFSGGDFSAAFLLAVGTNASQLHRVSATGSDRVAFVTALNAALPTGVTATAVTTMEDDGNGNMVEVYTGKVTISVPVTDQLYLVDEFSLDADGVVRLDELTTTSANELFTLPPANDASFAFDLAFEVISGIERTTGSWGDIELAFGSADADAAGFNIFDLTEASLTDDINGFARLDYSAEMDASHRDLLESGLTQEVVDFNQVGANSVIGMLGQLRAWADRVADSTYLGNLDVPFADLVLGEVLGFDALVQETLLLDEIGEAAGDSLSAISKLIAKANIDGNIETLVPFTNVQELSRRLAHLNLLDLASFDGVFSFYDPDDPDLDDPNDFSQVIWYDPADADAHDPDNPKLLLPLTLSRLGSRVSFAESPVDFLQRAAEDEGGATSLLGPLALDFSSSTAELAVSESMNITLGILLGEGGNLDSNPPLTELGVTPLGDEVLAVTGGGEVQVVYGRLSETASFQLRVDGGDWQTVTITEAATSTNTTVQDLVDDINDQLTGSLAGISAEALHGRIVLVADGTVDAFDLNVLSSDAAYREIGLAPSRASNVSLSLSTEADYELSAEGTITITPNGVAADDIVLTVPADITTGNRTLGDLVADLNAQLAADAGVIFSRSGNELILGSIAEGVHYLEVTFSAEFAGLFGTAGTTSAEAGLLLQASGEVADRYGTIAGDADLSIDYGAGTVAISVLASETQAAADEAGVRSIADLAELLNGKLADEGVTEIEFVALGAERLGIRALDDTVTQILVTNTDGGAEPLGFADSDDIDASLRLAAAESVAYYFGPDETASFSLTYDDGSGNTTEVISLEPTETLQARSLYDLQRVLQDKLDTALGSRLFDVGIDNGRLTLTADESIQSFSISSANGEAESALGLVEIDAGLGNLTANSDDLLVRTRDGSVFTVDLMDADDDIAAAIAAIQAAADAALGADQLTIEIAPDNASLLVTDLTGGSGSFAIETLNGSRVARQLGIFSESGEARQADVADNVIRGDRIGVPSLSDRLSIEYDGRDLLEAELTLTLPDFAAEARLGFIGVGLSAASPEITASFSMGLVDLGPDASGYTLRELFDAVRSSEGGLAVDALRLGQFIELPDITIDAGDIEFKASVLLGDDDPFEDYLGDLGLLDNLGNAIEETFVVRLGDFGNPIDTDLLDVLGQQAIDNNVSLNDLEGLEDLFEGYLNDQGIALESDKTAFDIVGDLLGLPEVPDIAIGDGTNFNFDSFEEALEAVLGDLGSFSALDFSDFGAALESLIDIVQGFSEVDFLSEEIPLLGVSVLDMVGIADDFASGIEEILDNPVATLQELEARLGEALGLPEGAIGMAIEAIDGSDNLILEFDFSRTFSEPLNIQLDIKELLGDTEFNALGLGINDLGLYGAAGLAVSGAIDAKLSFGIDLASLIDDADGSVQEPEVALLYGDGRTNLSGNLSATGDNLTFNAALGPLGASVRDGTALIAFDFDLFDTASGSLDLTTVGSDFLDGLTFTPLFSGTAEATLPVYFPTSSSYLGDILLGADLSLDAGELNLTGSLDGGDLLAFSDGFLDGLDFENVDPFSSLPLMVDGFDLFLASLQSILQGQVFGVEIPFLADNLSGAAQEIEDFRQEFVDPFRTLVEEAPQRGLEIVQDLLFRSLWSTTLLTKLDESASAANVIADLNGRDLFDFGDIELGEMGAHLDGLGTDIDHYVRAETAEDTIAGQPGGGKLQWNFVLGGSWSPEFEFDFDLGFPALGLDLDVDPEVILDWSLGLGLGLSTSQGAYFDVGRVEYAIDGDGNVTEVDGDDADSDPDLVAEFQARAELAIGAGDSLTGRLGFLELVVTTNGDAFVVDSNGERQLVGTGAFADFEVDLVNTGGGDTLAFYELGQLDAEVTLEAGARLDVEGIVQFNDELIPEGTIAPLLPSLNADFVFDWGNTAEGLENPLIDGGLASGLEFNFADALNEIAFENVQLNIGSFLSDLVGPILGQIQEITGPLEPIIEVITAPIPVISDLAGKPVTLVDLAATFGEFNPGFIYAIADIIKLANDIADLDGEDVFINIGDFVLVGEGGSISGEQLAKDSFDLAAEAVLPVATAVGDELDRILDSADYSSTKKKAASTTKSLTTGFGEGGGFAFPIFQDPSQIFGLLIGKPAVLVTYDMPPFVMDFEYQQSFPVYGPIFAVITVGLGMQIDLAFGYDTQGFQTFADGDFENPLDLLGGFYVSDRENADGSGADVPELILSGDVFAGAEVNLGIGSAGVEGGVILTVNFDLYDPDRDGRVRLSELYNTIEFEALTGSPILAPISIFDIYGDVAAQLRAYIKILTSKFTIDITPPIVLFEFEIPFDREPILANEEGGTLILNIGDYSHLRQEGDTRDIGETIRVEQIGDDEVKVWSEQFGVPVGAAQTYSGVERILVRGGEGDDTIDLSRVTTIAAEVYGGEGNDTILLGGGNDLVYGGLGNDIIDATQASGGGANIIVGGRGDDEIKAGSGDDLIFGGSVFLNGRDDDGTTDDWTEWTSLRFTAGTYRAADGNNRIHTGDGQNLVIAGAGDDVVVGGSGQDTIFADGGNFEISKNSPWGIDAANYLDLGQGGNDYVFGGGDDDTIHGGPGNDVLKGGEGNDEIHGNKGFDILFGDGSAFGIHDPITADDDFTFDGDTLQAIQWAFDATYSHGDNTLFGGTEDDLIFGGFGDSVIDGGRGGDTIFGDGGRVEYTAEGIAIRIHSLTDTDDSDGLTFGTNTLVGGGNGGNILFGGAGVDEILGGGGPDLVFGGNGADTIDGADGADVLFGDTGLVAYKDYAGEGVHRLIGDEDPTGIFDEGSFDDNTRTLDLIQTDPAKAAGSGIDTVVGGAGDDIVLGGGAGDFLYGDWEVNPGDLPATAPQGGDIVVGDWGRLEFHSRRITTLESLFAGDGVGGDDTLYGNGGNDVLIGGSGGDTLHGVNGGTLGSDTFSPNIVKVVTGFDDEGQPILADATGDDIVIGDNARLEFDPAVGLHPDGAALVTFGGYLTRLETTDTRNATGGVDTLFGDLGSNVLVGGAQGDDIYGAAGDDIILGDNGVVTFGSQEEEGKAFVFLEQVESVVTGNTDYDENIVGSNPFVGGVDTILGFTGTEIALGGIAGDTIDGHEGDDILLGDNGLVELIAAWGVSDASPGARFFLAGVLERIVTTDTENASGGVDTVKGGKGSDILLGGAEGDTLYGDLDTPLAEDIGDNLILGDNGELVFDVADPDWVYLSLVRTLLGGDGVANPSEYVGGDDIVYAGDGTDIVLGGIAGDTLHGQDGRDILLGDNGRVELVSAEGVSLGEGLLPYLGGAVSRIVTTDTENASGGVDTVKGGEGSDIILGGAEGDILYGDLDTPLVEGIGDNLILGDNGELLFNTSDSTHLYLESVKTWLGGTTFEGVLLAKPAAAADFVGGEDLVYAGDGADIVLGGLAGDEIHGQEGEDILLGDNGQLGFLSGKSLSGDIEKLGGVLSRLETTDAHDDEGGQDLVLAGSGDDIVLGGVLGDLLFGETGEDVLLGDQGRLEWNKKDDDAGYRILDLVTTTNQATLGGRDLIDGGANDDVMFGGTDSDLLFGGTGDDLMFGDHGKLQPQLNTYAAGHAENFFAIDTGASDGGAGDLMFGGDDDDIMLGQQGNDAMYGGAGDDDMIGGHNVEGGIDWLGTPTQVVSSELDWDKRSDAGWPHDYDPDVAGPRFNDLMDGGSGSDVMLGDNGEIWRRLDSTSERHAQLNAATIYAMPGVGEEPATESGYPAFNQGAQGTDPNWSFGRTITLLDHDHATQDAGGDDRPFGDDLMAGGADGDMLFGQLGDDVAQGDGSLEILGDFDLSALLGLWDLDIEAWQPDTDTTVASLVTGLETADIDPLRAVNIEGDAGPHAFELQVDDGQLAEADNPLLDLRFNILERASDGDDYLEGNGGSDLLYGGLGQDDIIGGSSALFGLVTADQRPDTGDELYGGAGERLQRNAFVDHDEDFGAADLAWQDRHGRDADVILGDNANVYRLVGGDDQPLTFNFDTSRNLSAGEFFQARQFGPDDSPEGTWYGDGEPSWILIQPRAFELLDYQAGVGDTNGGGNSGDDLIHGESGDDLIHGMAGHDAIFGNSEDDRITGGTGNDWISGGSGEDGVIGDDGLILPSRNGQAEPLFGIQALTELDKVISTPGNIQQALINQSHELKLAVRLFAFPGEGDDALGTDEGNDIVFGGLGNDWLHGGAGDDAISGAEALPGYYDGSLNWLLERQQELWGFDDAIVPWYADRAPINPGDILQYDGRRPGTGEFALYDEHDPWRRTMLGSDGEWLKSAEWVDAATALGVLGADATLPGNAADYLDLLATREVDGGVTEYLVGLDAEGQRVAMFDFLLNFDPAEGVKDSRFDDGLLSTDGDDRIFGDLGNDWQVGGSGRDHMYGGRGDDMLNMDDDHGSNFGDVSGQNGHPHFDGSNPLANNLPDAHQAYADIVYGGAGRDRLILNTGADRAIDWVGEFNSYVVPFSPFGAFHISRSLQPHLQEFLYELSASDGADQWAPDHERFDDHFAQDGRIDQLNERVERHYEPYGELGMVLQQDFDWNEQTGAPDDPQPGNFQGKREIMRRELFLDDVMATSAFSVEAGDWTMGDGLYTATAPVGEEAVSIQHMQDQLPGYLEILVEVRVDKDKGGVGSNAYLIFDYQDADDFKFAGIDQSTNKLLIGQRTALGWVTLSQVNLKLWHDRTYDLGLVLNGNLATVVIDGQHEISYAFADALNDGYLALGADNSVSHFSNYQVQKLPPLTTHESVWDFAGSEHGLQAVAGDWQLDSGLLSGAASADSAMLFGSLPQGVGAYAVLELEARLLVDEGRAGLVYDYHDVDDYKFALLDAASGQLVLGYVAGGDPVVSTTLSVDLVAGEAYDLKLTLTGGQVAAALKAADADDGEASWQRLGHVYYSLLNAGDWGLLVEDGGVAEFDHLKARTNDSIYLDDAAALVAGEPATGPAAAVVLPDGARLAALLEEAIGRLQAAHADAADISADEVPVEFAALGGQRLAQVVQGRILLDIDAAGHGWFVDESPGDDVEFDSGEDGVLRAVSGGGAEGRIDLLSVLMHELGHLADLAHAEHGDGGLMAEALDPGVRLLPSGGEDDAAEPAWPGEGRAAEPLRGGPNGASGLAVGHGLLLFDLRSGALHGDEGGDEAPPLTPPVAERPVEVPEPGPEANDVTLEEDEEMTFDTVGSSALSTPISLLGKFRNGLR